MLCLNSQFLVFSLKEPTCSFGNRSTLTTLYVLCHRLSIRLYQNKAGDGEEDDIQTYISQLLCNNYETSMQHSSVTTVSRWTRRQSGSCASSVKQALARDALTWRSSRSSAGNQCFYLCESEGLLER